MGISQRETIIALGKSNDQQCMAHLMFVVQRHFLKLEDQLKDSDWVDIGEYFWVFADAIKKITEFWNHCHKYQLSRVSRISDFIGWIIGLW